MAESSEVNPTSGQRRASWLLAIKVAITMIDLRRYCNENNVLLIRKYVYDCLLPLGYQILGKHTNFIEPKDLIVTDEIKNYIHRQANP